MNEYIQKFLKNNSLEDSAEMSNSFRENLINDDSYYYKIDPETLQGYYIKKRFNLNDLDALVVEVLSNWPSY